MQERPSIFLVLLVPTVIGCMFPIEVSFLEMVTSFLLIAIFFCIAVALMRRFDIPEPLQSVFFYVIISTSVLASLSLRLEQENESYDSLSDSKNVWQVESLKRGRTYNRYVARMSSGSEKLVLYIKGDQADMVSGDVIVIDSGIDSIKSDGNGNWANLFARNEIFYQAFINGKEDILVLEDGPFLSRMIHGFRRKAQAYFASEGLGELNSGLYSAMLLGDKSGLDKQLLRTFSITGTMHILAVSGLHVGIVYLILEGMIKLLSHVCRRSISSLWFVIVGTWSFAAISGFSESVIRASMMLSLYLIARSNGLRAKAFNILSFSAFVSLLFNPECIYQVGFQLSHLAVYGIITFFPILKSMIEFRSRFPSYLWTMICLSTSAQITTFPLALYYFGIFPNYFLLSNLMAVPASAIFVSAGIFNGVLSALGIKDGMVSGYVQCRSACICRFT